MWFVVGLAAGIGVGVNLGMRAAEEAVRRGFERGEIQLGPGVPVVRGSRLAAPDTRGQYR
jgi:hypothetical protein